MANILDKMTAAWQAMSVRPRPRNVKAAAHLADGDTLIVSFIGETDIDGVHVYVDGGERYDWRFAGSLQCIVVAQPGIRCAQTLADVFEATLAYPTFVDVKRKLVSSIVGRSGNNIQFWPHQRGSDSWRTFFD